MNFRQKVVLLAAVAVMALMLLFPPFHMVIQEGTYNAGYGFITGGTAYPNNAVVNVPQLLCQWFVVALATGLAWYLLKDSE